MSVVCITVITELKLMYRHEGCSVNKVRGSDWLLDLFASLLMTANYNHLPQVFNFHWLDRSKAHLNSTLRELSSFSKTYKLKLSTATTELLLLAGWQKKTFRVLWRDWSATVARQTQGKHCMDTLASPVLLRGYCCVGTVALVPTILFFIM